MALMLLFYRNLEQTGCLSDAVLTMKKKPVLTNEDCSLLTEAQQCLQDNSRGYAKVYWKNTHTHTQTINFTVVSLNEKRHVKPSQTLNTNS